MYIAKVIEKIHAIERDTRKPCSMIVVNPRDMPYLKAEAAKAEMWQKDGRTLILFGLPVVEDFNEPRLFRESPN